MWRLPVLPSRSCHSCRCAATSLTERGPRLRLGQQGPQTVRAYRFDLSDFTMWCSCELLLFAQLDLLGFRSTGVVQ